jgi:hypothetical protein
MLYSKASYIKPWILNHASYQFLLLFRILLPHLGLQRPREPRLTQRWKLVSWLERERDTRVGTPREEVTRVFSWSLYSELNRIPMFMRLFHAGLLGSGVGAQFSVSARRHKKYLLYSSETTPLPVLGNVV